MFVCMCAKLLQSCPTLCDPVDGSPAGSPILFFDVRLLQSCPTCCDPMHCSPPGFSVLGDSPGKNTGVGCHFLLQGIFPTQGSNLCLLCLLPCGKPPFTQRIKKKMREGRSISTSFLAHGLPSLVVIWQNHT